jgi:hypothetical protein
LRIFKVGEVAGKLKWQGVRKTGCLHLIERWRERLSGADAVYRRRNLVVLPVVEDCESEVIGVDVIGGSGNGGRCGCFSHRSPFAVLEERGERHKWMV